MRWLSNGILDLHIEQLCQQAASAEAEAEARRARNVVDPFSSLLIASTFGIEEPSALQSVQDAESGIRGMSNALGKFHQRVLGSVDGWVNHDAGYDLESTTCQIVAEVKNKHNTMNAANRHEVESDLANAVRQKRGDWTAYLVLIVPRRPIRARREIPGQRNVWEIDGASFYQLVTGDANALHDLFDYVCDSLAPNDAIAGYCRNVLAGSIPPRV